MPLIYPPQDPRRIDNRLYKGGDGGAGEMRKQEEERQRKVQAAVDAINAKFGIASSGPAQGAPAREQFMTGGRLARYVGGSDSEDPMLVAGDTGAFDEAGYNRAMAEWQASQTDANAAKASREALYNDVAGAVRDTAMRDLDRRYTDVSRKNTFGLARAGLLGGSVDAEAGGELSTLYGEGKLKASEAGNQAAADLRTSDERTRQNLISLAQSGIDTGTAASMAAGQMSAAADLAKSQAAQASVGDLFGDLSMAYLQNQMLKARYPNGMPQSGSGTYGSPNYDSDRYYGRVTN